MSKWLSPKCAVCMAEYYPCYSALFVQHYDCDGHCRKEERTLVDMDKGTHHDTTAHVSDMAQERWDYFHRPTKVR